MSFIGPQAAVFKFRHRLPLLLAILIMALMPLVSLAVPPADEADPTETTEETNEYRPSVGLVEVVNSTAGQETGVGRIAGLGTLTGSLMGQVIALVGVIFFVLMIYAGIIWMTASGNEERAGKAKSIMTGAVIGMLIVFASYYILDFVLSAIYQGLGA